MPEKLKTIPRKGPQKLRVHSKRSGLNLATKRGRERTADYTVEESRNDAYRGETGQDLPMWNIPEGALFLRRGGRINEPAYKKYSRVPRAQDSLNIPNPSASSNIVEGEWDMQNEYLRNMSKEERQKMGEGVEENLPAWAKFMHQFSNRNIGDDIATIQGVIKPSVSKNKQGVINTRGKIRNSEIADLYRRWVDWRNNTATKYINGDFPYTIPRGIKNFRNPETNKIENPLSRKYGGVPKAQLGLVGHGALQAINQFSGGGAPEAFNPFDMSMGSGGLGQAINQFSGGGAPEAFNPFDMSMGSGGLGQLFRHGGVPKAQDGFDGTALDLYKYQNPDNEYRMGDYMTFNERSQILENMRKDKRISENQYKLFKEKLNKNKNKFPNKPI